MILTVRKRQYRILHKRNRKTLKNLKSRCNISVLFATEYKILKSTLKPLQRQKCRLQVRCVTDESDLTKADLTSLPLCFYHLLLHFLLHSLSFSENKREELQGSVSLLH